MKQIATLLTPVLLVLGAGTAWTNELPRAAPDEVGLSAEKLAKIDEVIQGHVENQAIAGAVTVVARKGKVAYFKAFGDFEEDSIVRIYSMSKPVTVVAALMLVDDGKLKLDDPVAKYLPAFADVTVDGAEEGAEKPAAMTIRHLMQHTAGLTYGFMSNTPSDREYRRQRVLASKDLEEMTAKLAAIPLIAEPGTRWHYSVSIDVLGRVIEVVSKQPFDVFLKERLFDPLDMRDTAFFVPEDKTARFVPCYGPKCIVIEDPETSRYLESPGLISGGGGLVSTARDFTIFALMLADGGAWNGKRILKPETARAMATNHLPEALVPIRFGTVRWKGMGFGLGVCVRVAEAGDGTRVGDWGWGGAASTTFFVSPAADLVMVNLIQRMPMWMALDNELRPIVYGAITKQPEPVGAGSGR